MQEKFCPSIAFYAKGIFVGQMFRKKIDCLSEEKVALPIYIQHATHLGKNHGVHLKKLGKKYATPIFDGATIDQINDLTDEAGIPRYGHTYLYDGGTGTSGT